MAGTQRSVESRKAILVDYCTGVPVSTLAKKHGIPVGSLYYYLKRYGSGPNRPTTRKYECKDLLFNEMSEEGMYWLGFCVADGHVRKSELQIQLAKKDRAALVALRAALQTKRPIYDYWNRKFPKSCLYVTSSWLTRAVRQFSPGALRETPRSLKRHLIRGLFDGDGSVSCGEYVYGKRYKVTFLGTRSLLEEIRSIVSSQAGCSSGSLAELEGIWEWSLSGAVNLCRFFDWLYKDATIFMQRKRSAFKLNRSAKPRKIRF